MRGKDIGAQVAQLTAPASQVLTEQRRLNQPVPAPPCSASIGTALNDAYIRVQNNT